MECVKVLLSHKADANKENAKYWSGMSNHCIPHIMLCFSSMAIKSLIAKKLYHNFNCKHKLNCI